MLNTANGFVAEPQNGQTEWLTQLLAKQPRTRTTNACVVVVTPYGNPERFSRSHMGKVLMWGLQRKKIDWVLCNPVRWKLNPRGFDGVLSWPYGFRQRPNFLQSCVEFERRARDIGLPVINSLAGCDFQHTWFLRLWKSGGIQCPAHQSIRSWKDIQLGYPVILRTDNVHLGLNMYLAADQDEAKWILARDITPPLDLAIEFIDTKGEGGYYRKWRSHVIGDFVIPRQLQLSRTWKVNLSGAQSCPEATEEDRAFMSEGEPHAKLVVLAAKVLNADIIALDYSKKPDGSYVFWDANRNFDLSLGGQMWSQFRSTTGRSDEECRESVRVIADAIGKLILDRLR
jgi:hypothetical protein